MRTTYYERRKLAYEIIARHPLVVREKELYLEAEQRLIDLFREVEKIRTDTLLFHIAHLEKGKIRLRFIDTAKYIVCIWSKVEYSWCQEEIVDKNTMIIPKDFELEQMYYTIETLAEIEKSDIREMIKVLVDESEADLRDKKMARRRGK